MGAIATMSKTVTEGTRDVATDALGAGASIATSVVGTGTSLVKDNVHNVKDMLSSVVGDIKSFVEEHPVASLAAAALGAFAVLH